MRETEADNAAVASQLVIGIRRDRATQLGKDPNNTEPIMPDGQKRAFILDSIRHPREVALLRQIYQEAFCLVGVVCEESIRKDRLSQEKYRDAGVDPIIEFMSRDENAPEKHGQRVAEAFHLADYFIDNSLNRFIEPDGTKTENPDWDVSEQLGRLVDILTHSQIIRPRPNETGIFHAHGAGMRSSCLSRQVGAALLDNMGDVIATGANEVPRPGGGVYGGHFANRSDIDPPAHQDFRCFVHKKYCSNTQSQREIVVDLLNQLEKETNIVISGDLVDFVLKTTRIGQLIEFSRAVHAEMDALLSAARQGISAVGTRLFVTTFPCHNCARHIVCAGVDEVQFIEPYLKSQALPLHGDAITLSPTNWQPPSSGPFDQTEPPSEPRKVLFRPFVGIAPRLYRRVFLKDRELKESGTGKMKADFSEVSGFDSWETLRLSYAQVEAKITELSH